MVHSEIIRILLDQNDVNPNQNEKTGQTPLHYAASRGDYEVVKYFLKRKDIHPNVSN